MKVIQTSGWASHLTIAVMSLAVSTSSCSGSEPADTGVDGGEGVAVDEYCPTFSAILCAGFDRCCGVADLEVCVADELEYCEAGEISSIRAGHSILDGVVAERCFEAWEGAFDDCLYNDRIGEACRYQWYGTGGPGDACRDVWYCQPGLGCANPGLDGVCVELPGEGESCAEAAECSPGGLYCSYEDWICHPEPGLDEPCERTGICAAGRCIDGVCQATSWCR